MLEERIEAFRAGRRELERAVLSLATSIDGRRFSFQASAARPPAAGRRLRRARGRRPAAARPGPQSRARRPRGRPAADGDDASHDPARARGDGRDPRRRGPAVPRRARCARPPPRRCAAWLERTAKPRARLRDRRARARGRASRTSSTPAASTATRSCAASRARARRTRSASSSSSCCRDHLRIVILDPNSDFVRLGDACGRTPTPRGGALPRGGGGRRGPRRPRAATSGCGCVRRARHRRPGGAAAARSGRRPRGVRRAGGTAGRGAAAVARRADDGRPARGAPAGAARCATSASRGSASGRGEQPGSVLEALGPIGGRAAWSWTSARCPRARSRRSWPRRSSRRLWHGRERREPVLIVIDEAHNVCPAEPEDPLTALATEARRADRGRGAQVRALHAGRPRSARRRSTRTSSRSATTWC